MKDADKNRDPERARKRAKSDARCALKKLELLDPIEGWFRDSAKPVDQTPDLDRRAASLLSVLCEELGVEL